MKQDAVAHADEDKKKKEAVEVKNSAEALVYSAEKTLKDFSDKIQQDVKTELDGKVDALKKVKDGDDIEAIKKASADLSEAVQKIGAEMYKQQGAAGKEPSQEEKKKDDENPIEGDFEEKK